MAKRSGICLRCIKRFWDETTAVEVCRWRRYKIIWNNILWRCEHELQSTFGQCKWPRPPKKPRLTVCTIVVLPCCLVTPLSSKTDCRICMLDKCDCIFSISSSSRRHHHTVIYIIIIHFRIFGWTRNLMQLAVALQSHACCMHTAGDYETVCLRKCFTALRHRPNYIVHYYYHGIYTPNTEMDCVFRATAKMAHAFLMRCSRLPIHFCYSDTESICVAAAAAAVTAYYKWINAFCIAAICVEQWF